MHLYSNCIYQLHCILPLRKGTQALKTANKPITWCGSVKKLHFCFTLPVYELRKLGKLCEKDVDLIINKLFCSSNEMFCEYWPFLCVLRNKDFNKFQQTTFFKYYSFCTSYVLNIFQPLPPPTTLTKTCGKIRK